MKPKKGTITTLILILVGTSVGFAIYILMYIEASTLFNENKEINVRIAEATAKEKEMESIKRDIKATFNDYEKIQNLFVGKEETVDFIQGIELLGKDMNVSVKIESVTNNEFKPLKSDKEEVVTSLTALGSKNNVTRFLTLLEYLPYKVVVHDALIQKVDGVGADALRGGATQSGEWQLAANIRVIKLK